MTFGFIGAGNMASAIVRGAVESGYLKGNDIFIADRSQTAAQALAREVDAHEAASNTSLVKECDVIVLAVKPAQIGDVLTEIADTLTPEKLLISIAAGISLEAIESYIGQTPLVRVMPNMNASIAESMTGICSNAEATREHISTARTLMNSVGRTLVIDEGDFPVFSALAGCSPAWMYEIIDSLARAGVKYGIPKAQAVAIVAQAMVGSAQLVLTSAAEDERTPAELIDRVCSPGGTTIAGLLAAQEAGLGSALVKAVDAAVARDGELG
ncbi:MAG: pyrroline-5-carboxylate reductase [Actinomycetaceae bacterium]|nr:pyrroline-5-carboxylate reductase [Actinomycetaceae bacterium]